MDYTKLVYDSDKQNVKLSVNYKIILANNKILSIIFEGYTNNPSAPHEKVIYNAINFDMKKSIEIDLYSILNTNEDFFSIYIRNADNQLGERFDAIEKYYNNHINYNET